MEIYLQRDTWGAEGHGNGAMDAQSGHQDWAAAQPALIMAVGDDVFPARLDAALRTVAPFDLTCAFAYPTDESPQLLHDTLASVSTPEIMRNYLNGTYLLDAVYTACRRGTPPGLYRLAELAPDAFFEGEYYNSPDVHPCISMESGALAEEIVFLARTSQGVDLAYSLLRQNGSPAFSESDFSALQAVTPMVLAFMMRHWQGLRGNGGGAGDGIEQAFATFAAARLTAREQTIVSLILRGHSSASIGLNLGIAEGTVKIHRKHIYAKLDISSQTELFNLFVRHILKGEVIG